MTQVTAKLEGKVAFITGAARGQGRSHAIRLAQEGADIIAVDVCAQIGSVAYPMSTPDDLAETVKEVEALDRRIVARQADVRDEAGLRAVLEAGVVNSVHPTGVSTPMVVNDVMQQWLAADPSVSDAMANALPVDIVEAVDISNAILWLVSDDARYVTGVTLPVDAGFTNKK